MHGMKIFSSIVLAAVVVLVAACAAAVQPGMSRDEVIAHYGRPSKVLPLGAGTRLQYSRQPAGQSVVNVDMDAAGRVVSVRQVMTFKELSKIEPGRWTREEVEREFGRPASMDRVAFWPGEIMTYRWRDSVQDMFFWVYLDADNRVQRTGQGMELPVDINDN